MVGPNQLCLFHNSTNVSLISKFFEFDESLPRNMTIQLLKILKNFKVIFS